MTNANKLPHKQPAFTVRTFSINPASSCIKTGNHRSGTTRGTLTEFTRRKNWSQRIIDELKDFIHVLSPHAKIMYCSPATSELFGYAPEELVGRQIADFIHLDDIDLFRREFNESCLQHRKFHLYYRFRKNDSTFVSLEVIGHAYFGEGQRRSSSLPLCFFGSGKVYPNKAANLIDSFLELKMEKEMLERQISEAKAKNGRTRSPSSTSSGRKNNNEQSVPSSSTSDEQATSKAVDRTNDMEILPYEPVMAATNAPFVYTLGVKPENDISEAVQMFTGLRYDLGERSSGISTGSTAAHLLDPTLDLSTLTGSLLDTTPVQILNPSTFANPTIVEASTDHSNTKRKKQVKDALVVHVCTDCGTTDTPEWRKGPKGPKTLCNACGLRAKNNQKANISNTST